VTDSLGPMTLTGSRVRLEPLRRSHMPALLPALDEREIWTWLPMRVEKPAHVEDMVTSALEAEARGSALPCRCRYFIGAGHRIRRVTSGREDLRVSRGLTRS
jgi:hypothetical protein